MRLRPLLHRQGWCFCSMGEDACRCHADEVTPTLCGWDRLQMLHIVHIRRAVHCHLIERMRTAWCTLKRSTFVKILALTASLLLCTRKLFSCKPHVFWRIRLKKLFSSIKRKETRVQAKTSLKTCLFWNAWNSVAGYSWWGDLAGNLHVKGNLR